MSLRYLLDTNILSEPLAARPDPSVLAAIRRHEGTLAIPAVVWHELIFGARRLPPSRRRDVIERYLVEVVKPGLPVLPYDSAAATWHGEERARLQAAGKPPSFADGQIAAIAKVNGLVLVSRNLADFGGFRDLKMESWFT